MMIKEAWKRISRRLLEHGWKLPNNHTPETWPRFDVDTAGSAIPELEELVRNGEPHLGMITSPLKDDLNQAELDKTKKKLHFAANDLEMCEADRAVVLARYTEVDSENVLLRGLLNRVLIEYKACGGIMSGTNRDIAIALGASNG